METSLLLVTVILSALVATSYSITCIKCMGMSDTPCSGPEVTCASKDDVCILTYTVSSFGGMGDSHTYMRDCGNRKSCSACMSFSNLAGKSKSASSCCHTDRCTPAQPVIPADNYNKNGVRCKTCMDLTDKPCQTDTYVDCLGEEKKCISQVSTIKAGPGSAMSMAIRACATEELCDLAPAEQTYGQFSVKMQSTCTGGGSGLHYNFFLLLMSASLLLKFI
ncbi:phospholipase A2 inhibitor and Ly6/PLAUR domain-containing protein-like [Pseudophryne corroboree]|uniref:phospholipase A2 inhibitor and Ly6/PLAUR domain-containing protein-like n=1 Tax=Pseudophryne corroboree TaxID=495146 RepID=UPI003081CFC3